MTPETRQELARRIFEHLDAGTTAMASANLRNPVRVYTDPAHAALERRVLFTETPLLAGLSCELPSVGDWLTIDDLTVPVLVVRTGPGEVRAFANVCRHRGARVAEGCGRGRRAFSCPYHGWTYGLDGRLLDVPGAAGFPDLDRAAHGLRPLPAAERDGLLWVVPRPASGDETLDPGRHLGALAAELASYDLARHHHFGTRTLHPRINWKVAVDTFLEAYHLEVLHAESVAPIFFGNLCLADGFGPHHRMIAVRRTFPELRDRPDAAEAFLRHTIELYTLFPNTVLVHQADHVEVWRIFPSADGPDQCTVHLALYVPEAVTGEKARRHWEANVDLAITAVDQEDFRLGAGMQRGFHAGAQEHVTYGRNEPALIHFHQSLRHALGAR